MPDKSTTIDALKQKIGKFIRDRDWEQFHSAKNLSMSMAIEAAELMELFQWQAPDRKPLVPDLRKKVEHELADVAIYVMDFCNLYGIDLSEAIVKKLRHNEAKYPAAQVRGKTHKYTYYREAARKRSKNRRKK
ncbi:MAG TPA: nucleotide pyrophosphohydrolase [Verrucomicrobiae bacterium]|jgi:NTP pyrophosphatase (non-canonical NTP hydrolase)|nr:nucleotide pyrophosphohydrolase [Verrucomicrobiae bacterium]